MKNRLSEIHDNLKVLEDDARSLENQNLGDIIRSAAAKVAQALDHPDLEKVGPSGEEDPPPFPGA